MEPNVSTSHITGNPPQPGDRVPDPRTEALAICGQYHGAGVECGECDEIRSTWDGDTLDDGTPVFDCPECGMLAVTAEEECPSLSVPRGVGHRPKGGSR